MQKERENLRVDIVFENEGGDIGEGNDSWWVKHEENPDTPVAIVETECEDDDKDDGYVSHYDIKDEVGRPVAGQRHSR